MLKTARWRLETFLLTTHESPLPGKETSNLTLYVGAGLHCASLFYIYSRARKRSIIFNSSAEEAFIAFFAPKAIEMR